MGCLSLTGPSATKIRHPAVRPPTRSLPGSGPAGAKQLRRLIHNLLDDLPYTRSELERRFLRLAHDAPLPPPVVNRHREGHRVDFAWPHAQLVVETDGRATHDNPYAFHNDRARDAFLGCRS